jgi:hypothetical protein
MHPVETRYPSAWLQPRTWIALMGSSCSCNAHSSVEWMLMMHPAAGGTCVISVSVCSLCLLFTALC